jgi:hypothetical protein
MYSEIEGIRKEAVVFELRLRTHNCPFKTGKPREKHKIANAAAEV